MLLLRFLSPSRLNVLFMSLFSEELNDSFNEDVLGETKEPTNCDGTEQKETKLDGACLSSSGE